MANVSSIKSYVFVWIALLVLLAITSATAYLHLGWGNTAINFAVAVAKLLLIAVFFMHLFKGDAALRLTMAAALFTLFLLGYLSFADVLKRDIVPAPWHAPASEMG